MLFRSTHVFHLAAQAGVRKSWGRDFQIYTVNNIDATQALLEASTRMPALERLVYASSSSVYGDRVAMPMREDALPGPAPPYALSAHAAAAGGSPGWGGRRHGRVAGRATPS